MKVKTSELKGHALDWAVAKCEGWSEEGLEDIANGDKYPEHDFSTNWLQGGPIIEQAGISLWNKTNSTTISSMYWSAKSERYVHSGFGPTPLIAAMRCYCLSKLGDEVNVPDVLK